MSGQPSYTETIKLELQLADIQSQLTQRTAELEAVKADRDEAIREHGKWILSYKDLKRLYEAATRARKRKAKGVTGEQHG